jgi:hypothetical protein
MKFKITKDVFILENKIDDFNLINKLLEELKNKIKENYNYTDHCAFNKSDYFFQFINKIKEDINKIFNKSFVLDTSYGEILFNVKKNKKFINNNSAFCGVLYCTHLKGPGLYFKDIDTTFLEEKGKFILFHPSLNVEEKIFDFTEERVAIYFNTNIYSIDDIKNTKNHIIKIN